MQETHPDEAIADGKIVAYIAENGEDVALWKNQHDEDGALEDLEAHELERAALAFNKKLRKPKSGEYDDAEEEVVAGKVGRLRRKEVGEGAEYMAEDEVPMIS